MTSKNRWKDAFVHGLLSWFPFLVFLVAIPAAVFVPNLNEFGNDWATLFPFVGSAAVFLGLLVVWFSWRGKTDSRMARVLFFIGLFFVLKDMIAPMSWGVLDGEAKLHEPTKLTLLELALLVFSIVCAIVMSSKLLRQIGVVIVASFAILQVGYLAASMLGAEQPTGNAKGPVVEKNNEQAKTGNKNRPNVYHFVFDAYSGLTFLDSVKRVGVESDFSGFVFFKNNLSNYLVTAASVPGFLSGTLYSGGSFAAWQKRGAEGGMRKILQNSGYEVSSYVPDRTHYWHFPGASRVVTSRNFALSFFPGAEKFRLAQVVMVRIAPNVFRQEVLKYSDKGFGLIVGFLNGAGNLKGLSGYRFYKRLSVPVLEQFLKDESLRAGYGHYNYVHVILPHPPLTWSATCEYTPSSTFLAQTDCSTLFMAKIVRRLKELKRFDSSLVIFQSDHGFHGKDGGNVGPEFAISPSVRQEIVQANRFFPKDGLMRRVHSLLLVKRPHSSQLPLQISTKTTQLLDIPATVFSTLKLSVPVSSQGRSVFDLEQNDERKIHVFSGIYTRNKDGKSQIFGRDVKNTTLGHISYNAKRGWRVEPPLRALW